MFQRRNLHQFLVAGDRLDGVGVGDAGAKFLLVDVVGIVSILHLFVWHPVLGCFHRVHQYFIHRVGLNGHWCVRSAELGQGVPQGSSWRRWCRRLRGVSGDRLAGIEVGDAGAKFLLVDVVETGLILHEFL